MTQHNIRFFCTDLDGTLLGHEKATQQFKSIWEKIAPHSKPMLCYTSGRLLDDILNLVKTGTLPEPEYIISGVGTSIYDFRSQSLVKSFTELLDEGWDIEKAENVLVSQSLPLEKQPAYYQNEYKSSWFLNEATPEQIEGIQNAMEEAGLEVKVVYSSSRHLDILPKSANKGNSLHWLLRHLKVPTNELLVAGDSGNDSAMFSMKGVRGIVVGNAQPELLELTQNMPIYRAPHNEICAQAVINGLRYYGIIVETDIEPEDEVDTKALLEVIRASGEKPIGSLTKEQSGHIRQGYHKAIEALKKNISPLGFTACSKDDNEVTGTDENYQSVWARDGAVTIIGSLPLTNQDDAIHACQVQTMETLLKHVSPNGQIPANVRIETETPDYSGVGGIASIDSGIWLIIAFHAYVAQTRNIDFLRKHIHTLQHIMTWLSAHDSNNDALLEIPEAGDWTDLFGRSYNVLYDEVLWYKCNTSFSRMLEMLGETQRASDYLRWARVIKREILANFWPTTKQHVYQSVSFAEQQFSIGDARYLLAQITPFDFSWRCDTFGNLLAFLYDVTDTNHASQTFKFLWGVGINQPYPVANIYPIVTMGDKDWRPYYAVNLLNLPNHYHNGGVWPLIGGHWVRFLNKLGLRDLALKELYSLSELNKLGTAHEWEFNEWAHGQTGRPMGKAFQAWSASEYIRACHELHIVAG
ncbi:MAG: HAD-IIB family hydrolase [Lewinellaceae bacterium]|nr:HAD-IIB family hydrolase [Saprospiraceae bacterium]MCB9340744.1 HAD-IIB family hydrolase [Lewinellaceae bacterium]